MDKEFLSQIDRVGDLLTSETEKLADDVLICECFCVSAFDIRQVCATNQVVDLVTLQENFNLGLGCQSCLKNLESWSSKIF